MSLNWSTISDQALDLEVGTSVTSFWEGDFNGIGHYISRVFKHFAITGSKLDFG